MNKSNTFWGIVLLAVGAILLLNNLFPRLFGTISVWDLIWPLILVGMGVWFLVGASAARTVLVSEPVSAGLEGAGAAFINLHHGAGRLELGGGAPEGSLLTGTCVGGAVVETSQNGAERVLKLRSKVEMMWMGFPAAANNHGYEWKLALAGGIPLRLKLETGASESILNLADLLVSELELSTGASSTVMTLPAAAGITRVKISSGAASVKIRLPDGVAGRIQVQSGLAGINIDPTRFPKNGSIYESAGYENAANRAEIFIETGVGSVEIN